VSKIKELYDKARGRAEATGPLDMLQVQAAVAAMKSKLDELKIPGRERRMALGLLLTAEHAQAIFEKMPVGK
jgi:hypothetical protein